MRQLDERTVGRRVEINDDLADLFAGSDETGEAGVRVAEYLVELSTLIVEWAKTPGSHGGNPYCHAFTPLAEVVGTYWTDDTEIEKREAGK